MRNTPRKLPVTLRVRGFGTLTGYGWLRPPPPDAPSDSFRGPDWDLRRSPSALRKCMFFPAPQELRDRVPRPSALPVQAPTERLLLAQDVVPHRRDLRRDAREFAAFPPGDPRLAVERARALHLRDAEKAARDAASRAPAAWWEDPVALGALLILAPPVGLAAAWSSKRYSSDARWALTVMTALTMCLMTTVIVAALTMK